MPTYVYECSEGHSTEEVRKIADRDEAMPCMTPHCGRQAKRIEISAATPYVTRPGVGDRSPFSRDRAGK